MLCTAIIVSLSSMIRHIYWRIYATVLKSCREQCTVATYCIILLQRFGVTYKNGSQVNTKTCGFSSVFGEGERVDTGTTQVPHNSILPSDRLWSIVFCTQVICLTVSRMSMHFYLIWNVLLPSNTMSLFKIHQGCLILVSSGWAFTQIGLEICRTSPSPC